MPFYLLHIFYGIHQLKLPPPKQLFTVYDFNYHKYLLNLSLKFWFVYIFKVSVYSLKKTVYELDTVDKRAIKKSKKKERDQEKNYIQHQQLQHQISRLMFLPTPTHFLQVKNQKKNICS